MLGQQGGTFTNKWLANCFTPADVQGPQTSWLACELGWFYCGVSYSFEQGSVGMCSDSKATILSWGKLPRETIWFQQDTVKYAKFLWRGFASKLQEYIVDAWPIHAQSLRFLNSEGEGRMPWKHGATCYLFISSRCQPMEVWGWHQWQEIRPLV